MSVLVCFVLLASAVEGFSNIARGKPTSQSSTHNGAIASRAVDGNTDAYLAGNSCSATQEETHSWWTLDLGREYTVYRIKITASVDGHELKTLYISVSGVTFYWGPHPVLRDGVLDIVTPTGVQGRHVWIDIHLEDTTWSLTLCEVQVYADLETYYQMDSKRVSSPELLRQQSRTKIECAHKCLSTVDCHSFLWNPSNKECALYSDLPTVTSSQDNFLGYIPV